MTTDGEIVDKACRKAAEYGADSVGFLPAHMLIGCPSELADDEKGFSSREGSYIVIGLFHDPDNPEMDFWEKGKGTPGDRQLGNICRKISAWLSDEHGRTSKVIPYQIYDGGIYLKDAAVLAGLGVFGKNNLVLVPGYGPHIRFRALWTDLEPEAPKVREISAPCDTCGVICINECPMGAFPDKIYSRKRCLKRTDSDKAESSLNGTPVIHCRICELSCPAGDLMENGGI